MLTVLVDYDSGNLHSAEKAFQRMALEVGSGEVLVTSRPEDVARADRIVLPGDGAFPACRAALAATADCMRPSPRLLPPAPAPSSASASACRCWQAVGTNIV